MALKGRKRQAIKHRLQLLARELNKLVYQNGKSLPVSGADAVAYDRATRDAMADIANIRKNGP